MTTPIGSVVFGPANPVTVSPDVDRARADLESAAAYLRSDYFEHVITDAVRAAVVAALSPWLSRKDVAARARCSLAEVDRATRAGILKRHLRGDTPLFDRDQVDAAIREGTWKR